MLFPSFSRDAKKRRWVFRKTDMKFLSVALMAFAGLVAQGAETAGGQLSRLLEKQSSPVEAREHYKILVGSAWPEQGDAIRYFSKRNAPEILALALPQLRNQARKHVMEELLKVDERNDMVIAALAGALDRLAVDTWRDTSIADDSRYGIVTMRKRIVQYCKDKLGLAETPENLDDPDQVRRFAREVLHVVGP